MENQNSAQTSNINMRATSQEKDLLLEINNNLKKLAIYELGEKIKSFKSLDIDKLTYAELASWAKWVNTVENLKEKINDLIKIGHELLKANNLQPLMNIIVSSKDKKEFDVFLKKILTCAA